MIDLEKIRRSVGMIGESDQIIEVLTLIGQIANTDISVLITGSTGSGKEMVAKAIHKNSKRKFESLVVVNCSAIPSGIIESVIKVVKGVRGLDAETLIKKGSKC